MKRFVILGLAMVALGVGVLWFVRKGDAARVVTALPEEASSEEPRQTMQVEHHDLAPLWPAEPVVENPGPTNWLTRLQAGEMPELSAEEAEAYVTANKRSAESLLAAFRASKDKAYLREALEKFPDDPKVNFAGYFEVLHNQSEYTVEERRAALERFAKATPENSLVNYLAASDYFKSGDADKALEQFRNAATKSALQDYSMEFVQNAEEAYRSAGYSEVDAKAIATSSVLLPHLAELKRAGMDLLELAGRYQQSGDEAQAREARELALQLAGKLEDGAQQKFLINQLVGIAIERRVLAALDPNSAYDSSGRTVQNRIEEMNQTRKSFKVNVAPIEGLLPTMTPTDQVAYFDRMRIYGEVAAAKWAVNKYAK